MGNKMKIHIGNNQSYNIIITEKVEDCQKKHRRYCIPDCSNTLEMVERLKELDEINSNRYSSISKIVIQRIKPDISEIVLSEHHIPDERK